MTVIIIGNFFLFVGLMVVSAFCDTAGCVPHFWQNVPWLVVMLFPHFEQNI